jgi:hypothetical protein
MKCEHEPCRPSKRGDSGRRGWPRGIQKARGGPHRKTRGARERFRTGGWRPLSRFGDALTGAVSMNVGRALSSSGVFGPPDLLPFPPFYRRSAARGTLVRRDRIGVAPFGLFVGGLSVQRRARRLIAASRGGGPQSAPHPHRTAAAPAGPVGASRRSFSTI